MRNVFRIFKYDLRNLYRNFFAFLIILAILVLPALYAWFNIYAFWDPYGKTKDVSIAVVSNDKDYMDSEGNIVNMGEALIDEIKDDENFGFVFLAVSEASGTADAASYARHALNKVLGKHAL